MPEDAEQIEILEEEEKVANLGMQALWVLVHSLLAIGSWALIVLLISMAHPQSVPVLVTLGLSFCMPLLVGFLFNRVRQNDLAPYTWLIGLIWFLIICLWVLDMPTGPNQCYHCDASEKLYLTFFSATEDSGLIDGQGRFIGTWPFAAFVGYATGGWLALRRKR